MASQFLIKLDDRENSDIREVQEGRKHRATDLPVMKKLEKDIGRG
jgi:hypothetical protein